MWQSGGTTSSRHALALFPSLAGGTPHGPSKRARSAEGVNNVVGSGSAANIESFDVQARMLSLMEKQTDALTKLSQHVAHDKHEVGYQDPHSLLKNVDPVFKTVFLEWQKEYNALVRTFVNQSDLHLKYSEISESGKLFGQFTSEAKRAWQWPKMYLNSKADVQQIGNSPTGPENKLLNVDQQWQALRQKHARECESFIFAHNQKCLEVIHGHADMTLQKQILTSRLQVLVNQNKELYGQSTCSFLMDVIDKFVTCSYRQQLPTARAKLEKHKKQITLRDGAVKNAEAQMRALTMPELLAVLALDNQSKLSLDGKLVHGIASDDKEAEWKDAFGSKSWQKMQQKTKVDTNSLPGMLLKTSPAVTSTFNIDLHQSKTGLNRTGTSRSRKKSHSHSRGKSQSRARSASRQRLPSTKRRTSHTRSPSVKSIRGSGGRSLSRRKSKSRSRSPSVKSVAFSDGSAPGRARAAIGRSMRRSTPSRAVRRESPRPKSKPRNQSRPKFNK